MNQTFKQFYLQLNCKNCRLHTLTRNQLCRQHPYHSESRRSRHLHHLLRARPGTTNFTFILYYIKMIKQQTKEEPQ